MQRLFAVVSLLAVFAWTRPSQAASVAIVSAANPSPEMAEALNLLRGELLSVGLAVTMERRPADNARLGSDSRRWLEDLAAGGANAVVDAVEVEAGLAVDVWIVKTQPLRFEVTRASVEPDTPKATEVLALRAVEALRGGLLLVDRAARRQQQESIPRPLPVVAGNAQAGAAERGERLGLEAGAALLAGLDGVGPALLPVLRASWAVHSSLLVQASLAGAGTRPTVSAPGGTVRVAQQLGTLGTCLRGRSFGGRLWPFFTLAIGGLHTSAAGQTDAVNEGHTEDQWSFLLDGSLGAGLQLSRRYYMTLAAHVQLAEPYVQIHVGDAVGATTGRPNLALTLTLGAWL